jgi:hypothetical protein
MKAIVYRGAQLLRLLDPARSDTSLLFKNHRLARLLPGVKAVLDCQGDTWEMKTAGIRNFEDFEELVRAIEELDPGSYKFRYPTDTKGEAALDHHTVVNPVAFARNMDPILELLAAAVTGLEEEFNAAAEAKFELQHLIDRITKESDGE